MKSGYVVFFVFLLVSTIPAVDIAFSALFYDGGGFVLQNNRPVELFELSVPIALGFCGLVHFWLVAGRPAQLPRHCGGKPAGNAPDFRNFGVGAAAGDKRHIEKFLGSGPADGNF